ncbi:MAG: oligoribonuclease [Halioglobus sp.]|jgi:oligoribonuclease
MINSVFLFTLISMTVYFAFSFMGLTAVESIQNIENKNGSASMGIFLDTETSGLDHNKHDVLEIGLKVVDMMNGNVLGSYESIVSVSPEEWECASKEALAVNGFKWEHVQKGKSRQEVSEEITVLFGSLGINRYNSCYICQNPSFDRGFFTQLFSEDLQFQKRWPYHWLDLASMNWGLKMHQFANSEEKKMEPIGFSKDKIAAQHDLPPEEIPHRAMNGVEHLFKIYMHIVGFRKV